MAVCILVAETGIIINSCMSKSLLACIPPLRIFIIGIGNLYFVLSGLRLRYNGLLLKAALAWATAIETPKIAFAPKFDLFDVPSVSIIS